MEVPISEFYYQIKFDSTIASGYTFKSWYHLTDEKAQKYLT